jgi:hypothetical protein
VKRIYDETESLINLYLNVQYFEAVIALTKFFAGNDEELPDWIGRIENVRLGKVLQKVFSGHKLSIVLETIFL